ncbi:MAG: sulfite exporter TauE/SafE family protein [Desulfosoma sp.]|uniref:sulfite exporter TauE/SafE family protein n=1 Tax=Desulfosoma sp. TaxID=2603217 RepID=UPI00404936D1
MNTWSHRLCTNYLPTALLLIAVTLMAFWSLTSKMPQDAGVPIVSLSRGTALVVIGFVAGVLGGLIGTGGCSVMLPVIHFWMGYPAPTAIGTTLFAVIFTAISGGIGHLARKNLDVRATAWLGGTGIVGVVAGSYLFTLLSGHASLLNLILGIAFLWPAVRMSWEGIMHTRKPQQEGSTVPGPAWGWVLMGLFVGVLTGVVGLGGGYVLVPGLIYLFGAPVYVTMGTSLATMIPLAVVGGGIKLLQGYVAVSSGLLLAGGTIIGAQVGAGIIKRFKPTTLKLIFGLYFLYVSIKFITGYFGIAVW